MKPAPPVLQVAVADGRPVEGGLQGDNFGSRFTGRERGGATANLNNLAGRGDQLGLRVLSSGEGLTDGRVSYLFPVGGGAYLTAHYELGEEFAALDAAGDVVRGG